MKLKPIIINILIIAFIKSNFIKLNFYKDKRESSYHIENIFFASISTDIYFGTPEYKISLQISTDSPYFVVKGSNDPNEYNQEKSSSFYFTKYGHSYEYKNIYFHSIFFQENFKFNNTVINLNSMMYWGKYPITYNYGLIGLQLYDIKFQEQNILINQLYDKGIIKEKMFSLIYENENKGELFIGDFPHNKTELLKGKKFKLCNNSFITNGFIYATNFDEIKFIEEYNIKNLKIKDLNYPTLFSNTYYGYIGSKSYNNFVNQIFFRAKLMAKTCWTQNIDNDRFYGYVCNKNVDTSNIPNIKFYHKDLNYTFEIENEEMWVIHKNVKYFIIFFSYIDKYSWILGQKFLEKYTFVFNGENNLIGFYYSDRKNKNNIFYFFLIIIVLIVIIGLFVYFRFFHFNKKDKIEERIELKNILNNKNTN